MAENQSQSQDLSGRSFAQDRYQLERIVSSDSLSNHYLAHDNLLGVKVIVRIVHEQQGQEPKVSARFMESMRAALLAAHPGLLRVYDFGVANQRLFASMEHLPGPTLAEMVSTMRSAQSWLALDEAFYLVQRVGETLAYLRRYSYHTRRVDPSQIKLRTGFYPTVPSMGTGRFTYQPVLLDLPLDAPHKQLTDFGIRPTFAYMAPEVIFRQGADEYSDIYVLGALAWELALNQVTFEAEKVSDAVEFHLNQSLPPIRPLHPTLPDAVIALLEKALAYSPSQRFATLAAMIEAIGAMPSESVQAIYPPNTTIAQLDPSGAQTAQPEPFTAGLNVPPERPIFIQQPGTPAVEPRATPESVVLEVQHPTQGTRHFELDKPILKVGRSKDNDVILDDQTVSRAHAQVEYDGYTFYIADLKSANGIKLEEMRIPPGEKKAWKTNTPIQIGGSVLQLVPRPPANALPGNPGVPSPVPNAMSNPGPNAMSNPGPNTGANTIPYTIIQNSTNPALAQPPLANPVGATILLEEEYYEVDPGQRILIPVTLRNLKASMDDFALAVVGVPNTRIFYPPIIRLAPNTQEQFMVQVEPMRSPQLLANIYPLQIVATSQLDQTQTARTQLKLNVKPYDDLHVALNPTTINEGETMRVNLDNQGNSEQLVSLTWWAQDEPALTFQPREAEVRLQPGQAAFVEFGTITQKTNFMSSKSCEVTVQTHAEGGKPSFHKGTIIRRGRLSIR